MHSYAYGKKGDLNKMASNEWAAVLILQCCAKFDKTVHLIKKKRLIKRIGHSLLP